MLIAIAARRSNVALYGTTSIAFRQQMFCRALEPQVESAAINTRQCEPHFMIAIATTTVLSQERSVA
jgi:hypothetical protein